MAQTVSQQSPLQPERMPLEYNAAGQRWAIKQVEDRARAVQGSVAQTPLPPAPAGQHISYTVGNAKDDSRIFGGAMNSDDFHAFMNAKGEGASKKSG